MISRMYCGLLIGHIAKVQTSLDKSLEGVTGLILNETKNTLLMTKGERRIIVPKRVVTIQIKDSSGKIRDLDGKELIATPQDRINKL